MVHHPTLRATSVLWALVAASAVLSAQEEQPRRDTVYQMSPVITTATQAREGQTPATFTNLKSAQITERYTFQDVPVLLSEMPSMLTYSENGNGIGYNYISLRGFDQRRVSVMVNGVPQNDPEDHNVYWLDFPDLLASTDMIQVQRGAGSAFYGPPAIGGSINMVTNPFGNAPKIVVESYLGFQEFADSSRHLAQNTKRLSASFTSGLVDGRYMFYGRLGKIQSDGYRQNSWSELNSYFFGMMRLDSTMTTRLHFFGGPLTDALAYTGLPKSSGSSATLRRQNLTGWSFDANGNLTGTARRPQETEYFNQPHAELIHEWKLSPALTLHNTLFYYSGDGWFDYDASWADTSTLRLGSAYGIPTSANPTNTLVRGYVGNRQWGWLPNIEIAHDGGVLTLGAELRFHRSTHWGKIVYAENLPASYDPDYHFYEYNGVRNILSVFGSETYQISEFVGVMASVQAVYNEYGIRNEKFLGNTFTVPYFFVNPRVGMTIHHDEALTGYWSVAYTSREPRMRDLYAAEDAYFGATPQFEADTTGGKVRYNFGAPLAKPERLFDVELGERWSTHAVQAAASLFWMEFTDELIKSGQVDIFGQPITGNAKRTRHLGVEIEGAAALTQQFSVGGNVSLSRNRLVRYAAFDDDGVLRTLDGNHIAGFPDVLCNLRLTYRAGSFIGSMTAKYVGEFYTDNFENASNKNDAYTVCNVELSYGFPHVAGLALELHGDVQNLFNRYYFMSGEGDAFFPAAERNYVLGARITL